MMNSPCRSQSPAVMSNPYTIKRSALFSGKEKRDSNKPNIQLVSVMLSETTLINTTNTAEARPRALIWAAAAVVAKMLAELMAKRSQLPDQKRKEEEHKKSA